MQNGLAVEPSCTGAPVAESVDASGGLASGRVDANALFAPQAANLSRIPPKRGVASPSWVIPPSEGLRCSELTYLAHAVVHPVNPLIVVGLMLLVGSHWSLGALALALSVEALYLLALPMCGFFRRGVHAGLEQQDREEKLRARDLLILQMDEGHRNELGRLEALLDGALVAGQRRRGGPLLGACDAVTMARLTLSYIRLAVDHRACAQALAMTDAVALHATIRSLEIATLTQPAPSRPRLRRWLEIARRRAERWRETHATMESLNHQLATLAELTRLVHQDAFSLSNSELSGEVDALLDEFEDRARAAQEVAGVEIVDAPT